MMLIVAVRLKYLLLPRQHLRDLAPCDDTCHMRLPSDHMAPVVNAQILVFFEISPQAVIIQSLQVRIEFVSEYISRANVYIALAVSEKFYCNILIEFHHDHIADRIFDDIFKSVLLPELASVISFKVLINLIDIDPIHVLSYILIAVTCEEGLEGSGYLIADHAAQICCYIRIIFQLPQAHLAHKIRNESLKHVLIVASDNIKNIILTAA